MLWFFSTGPQQTNLNLQTGLRSNGGSVPEKSRFSDRGGLKGKENEIKWGFNKIKINLDVLFNDTNNYICIIKYVGAQTWCPRTLCPKTLSPKTLGPKTTCPMAIIPHETTCPMDNIHKDVFNFFFEKWICLTNKVFQPKIFDKNCFWPQIVFDQFFWPKILDKIFINQNQLINKLNGFWHDWN